MNYKQLITKAREQGINPCEVNFENEEELNISVFRHTVENFSISRQSQVRARGVYNGKMGSASTERLDAAAADELLSKIRLGANCSEKEELPEIFPGSEKYTKKNVFSKKIGSISVEEKKALLLRLEQAAYDADPRVSDVQAEYNENAGERVMLNSYGLSLKSKRNYCLFVVEVVCKDGEEIKSGWKFAVLDDPLQLDPTALAEEAVRDTVSQFGGVSTASGAYKCVLGPDVTGAFLAAAVNAGFNAENIQKKSSVLAGKLGEKVFSPCVTIEEKPLKRCCFFRSFDDEGVACRDKVLVDKGVVKTWLYNLETARKDHTESTGNGYGSGKIGIRAVNLTLKSGRLSEEDLFGKAGNGVYITSVTGLHAGLNPQSGDFSLEASGYLIRDGKKASPLGLFTCAGNLYTLFKDVRAVANNPRMQPSGVTAGSVLVKSLKISCL